MIEKTYRPAEVEARIYAAWEGAGAFRCGRPERVGARPYCIVIPPPNVTGTLHMGHALNNTLQDILARFERMRGRDVLWQPGTDHAGIATQMVVERQLMERQEPDRRTLGRAEFIKRVWAWKEESGGAIMRQLKRLGASCDWSRERFTMDEGLSRAVVKVFVDLYKAGLIYKDKRLVNWDPKLRTAISDLEVQQIELKGHLWYFKYPIEGLENTFITVATTRPETMLGDTAVAVHPEDERYRHLIGKYAILPLVGRRIPIVADEYSDPEKGTGAVKVTPAHDFNDFEVGKRHRLDQVSVLDAEAKLNLASNPDFIFGGVSTQSTVGTDFPFPGQPDYSGHRDRMVEWLKKHGYDELAQTIAELDGEDRFAGRKKIVARMEAKGLVEKIEPHVHMVPHADRSAAVVEPFLTDQWFADAKTLARPAIEAVRSGRTKFVPKNWEKTYFDWMENIQPWTISRQLWWGHQIPCWYGPTKRDDQPGNVGYQLSHPESAHRFVCATESEAIEEATKHYGGPVEVVTDLQEAIARTKLDNTKFYIWRDPDVLDTWFSSALWPFSTLGWPDLEASWFRKRRRRLWRWFVQKPSWRRLGRWYPKFLIPDHPLERYYPTDALVTGFDIIFFWVARMIMMGLRFMEEVPFHTVYIHALVRDERGAKMSKSKGNVIDPLHLIDDYGADALRFTLAAMAAQGRDLKLATSRVEGYRNFATKLWNAARFAEINGCARVPGFDPTKARETLNRWIGHETALAGREVTGAIETYKFNEAAGALYRFVWNVYCDWYLELAKPALTGADGAAKEETRAMVAWVRDEILKLLHPFMPFVSEELWRVTAEGGAARDGLLVLADWPHHEGLDDPAAEAEIGWLVDLIAAIRSVRAEMNVPAAAQIPLVLAGASEETKTRAGRWRDVFKSPLGRVSDIGFVAAPPAGAVQIVVRGEVAALPLAGVIDLAAERARLEKEMAKVKGDIARVDAKLGNADFLKRAPEEVVEGEREKREEAEARRAKILEALDRLAKAS
jgi:valyl-tRNA synthetase